MSDICEIGPVIYYCLYCDVYWMGTHKKEYLKHMSTHQKKVESLELTITDVDQKNKTVTFRNS